MRKRPPRNLGSPFFGRTIRKWRLIAHLSQQELADRARLSVSLVGCIERERGHIAMETLCELALGLESALGRPMMESILVDSLAALWQSSILAEERLRRERGLPAATYEPNPVSEEELARKSDEAYEALRNCGLLWFRALKSARDRRWLEVVSTASLLKGHRRPGPYRPR